MGVYQEDLQIDDKNADLSTRSQHSANQSIPDHETDKDDKCMVCRVCHCVESDRKGDNALGFLGIIPPLRDASKTSTNGCGNGSNSYEPVDTINSENEAMRQPEFVKFVSPDGEVFVCKTDIEAGLCYPQDLLVNLGCSCKSDLALAHYACALKWFVSHGSSICEICGSEASNIKSQDLKKVISSLKEYESLRERTASGECTRIEMDTNAGGDPDAVAAIRRQRLSEISIWFSPHSNSRVSEGVVDQTSVNPPENPIQLQSPRSKWAIECMAILVMTGLLTATVAWLIAPWVGKKTAKSGLRILLEGLCALTVVIFLRFFVLSRIKHGAARFWAILLVFWFLVFAVWASRTHHAHTT